MRLLPDVLRCGALAFALRAQARSAIPFSARLQRGKRCGSRAPCSTELMPLEAQERAERLKQIELQLPKTKPWLTSIRGGRGATLN